VNPSTWVSKNGKEIRIVINVKRENANGRGAKTRRKSKTDKASGYISIRELKKGDS